MMLHFGKKFKLPVALIALTFVSGCILPGEPVQPERGKFLPGQRELLNDGGKPGLPEDSRSNAARESAAEDTLYLGQTPSELYPSTDSAILTAPASGATSSVAPRQTNPLSQPRTTQNSSSGLFSNQAPVNNVQFTTPTVGSPPSDPNPPAAGSFLTSNGPQGGEVLPPPPGLGGPVSADGFGAIGVGPGTDEIGLPSNFADLEASVQEAQSGRFMIGAGVNSNAGVTGQIVIDERNFNLFRPPMSWDDITQGRAFRGGGQGFRLEAVPGNQVQRYLVNWSEPYLFETPVSLSVSGFYYDRRYFDWNEQRLGGRIGLGYRLTHDLTLAVATRMESVKIFSPRVGTSPELNAALGDSSLLTGQVTLTHDTRDSPFAATEGHLIEMSLQQAFGTFSYPRADLDIRRYFLVRERPDGSGRHTFSVSTQFGVSGSQTPIYENYFAGGFSTLRGFNFRGASPVSGGVRVGGQMRWINSTEYLFPLTADDMIKGIVFCDFGTVEQEIALSSKNFRVAPGFGLRINIPALGNGAPLAFDFTFPVAKADTDDTKVFSFFMGLMR